MKTPRDLLLQRHRGAESALDEVRAEALRVMTRENRRESRAAARPVHTFFGTLWQELFVVCRRYWMGLGVAWCVIVLLAVAGRTEGSSHGMTATVASEPFIQAMREQARLRDELLGVTVSQEPHAIVPNPVLGPRSQASAGSASV